MVLANIQWSGVKVVATILVMFLAGTVCAAQVPQKAEGIGSGAKSLQQSGRWEADDVVHQSMESIRIAMAACKERIGRDQMRAQDYQHLAQAIDENVAAMLKNRKISKETEKAFHLVVMIDLAHSLQLMRTTSKTQIQRAGAFGVLQALRNYGEYFLPPGSAPNVLPAMQKPLL